MSVRQANQLNRKLGKEEKARLIVDYLRKYGADTPLSVAWEFQDQLRFTEGECWRFMWLISELEYLEKEGKFEVGE